MSNIIKGIFIPVEQKEIVVKVLLESVASLTALVKEINSANVISVTAETKEPEEPKPTE